MVGPQTTCKSRWSLKTAKRTRWISALSCRKCKPPWPPSCWMVSGGHLSFHQCFTSWSPIALPFRPTLPDMPAPPGFWRKCRTGFRWCRLAVWFTVLALVCALVWFNRVGLPDFLKRRLVETLHRQGIELAFTRMRLHLVRGLVVENVRLGHAEAPEDPVFSLA